jgi:cell division initiation protein
MNVSPLDLRQQHFRNAFWGFDKVEVASFLAAVADDYEQALRETDQLRQELGQLEAIVKEHREQEMSLRNTLMTAQRLSEEIKEHAEQEAGRIVKDAEARADLVLEKTHVRLDEIQREIDGLRLKRREAEVSVESTIQTLRTTLEFMRERQEHEAEEKILLHRPRQAPESAKAPAPDAVTAAAR